MTNVFWFEQAIDDVPVDDEWLSVGEALVLARMRVPKRRSDWRLGRWTAKNAVASCLGLSAVQSSLAEIEIRPSPSGAPEVFLQGQRSSSLISISHCDGVSACAITSSGTTLGCDLELVEPRSVVFIQDYFTAEEQTLIAEAPAAERDGRVALFWSAKESALKALREGLRLDTRSVVVSLPETPDDDTGCEPKQEWRPLQVRYTDGQVFKGWWNAAGNFVRTLVAIPPPSPPVLLIARHEELAGV